MIGVGGCDKRLTEAEIVMVVQGSDCGGGGSVCGSVCVIGRRYRGGALQVQIKGDRRFYG